MKNTTKSTCRKKRTAATNSSATSSSPVDIKHGASLYRCVTADIAERKPDEVARRVVEQRYRMLFEEAPVMYLTTRNVEGNPIITDCNDMFLNTLGYRQADVVGRPLTDFYTEDSRAKCRDGGYRRAMEGRFKVEERQLVARDGTVIEVAAHGKPVTDPQGCVIGTLATFNDITERKRAEEALRTNAAQLSNALKLAHAGHWEYDVASDEFTFNDNFYRIFRTTAEKVGTCKMSSADYARRFCHPDDAPLVGKEVLAAIETNDPQYERQIEHRILYADGAVGHMAVRFFIVKDQQGRTVKTFGVNQDITERKQEEGKLREANEQIQKSLDDLKRAQQKLIQQERLAALGQMASGIAHDFNNTLMTIMGFSELLISDPGILDDRKKALHMIEVIHAAGNDARQIVRRLRTVYRKDDDVEYMPIDIARIAESAISITMPKWKEEMRAKGVAIEIATDFQPVPRIEGNESEMREALTNLIFNSTDAMPEGGVIAFHLCRENDASIILEVTDTGIGMDQETLRHCMEPFYTTKGKQGSGLGLAMVHGIVERHGGVIEIESKPGAGTKIRMRFPAAVETVNATIMPETKRERLPPLRVLVIDDEARSRDLIAGLLKNDGHHVMTAEGGREGLEILRYGSTDFIITDRAMPAMSGDEVAKEAHKIQPGTPIIMLTGFGDIMKDGDECPLGVARVMSKPVTAEELRRVMASVMRKVRGGQNDRQA